MTYTVHEIFHTLQGEGANMGCPAVFIRFSGCNLWTGREEDRASAVCRFCDTDFRRGRRMTAEQIARQVETLWTGGPNNRLVVLTGGEPLLQVDAALIGWLKSIRFQVAVETNGTKPMPRGLDWVCVSPKAGAPLATSYADELKLVFPQDGLSPDDFAGFNACHRWLSPMAGPALAENTAAAAAYCKAHPEWRLNIQAHKTWGLA